MRFFGNISDTHLGRVISQSMAITYFRSPKQDSKLGLSMSQRLNYEAAAWTTLPPWLDIQLFLILEQAQKTKYIARYPLLPFYSHGYELSWSAS